LLTYTGGTTEACDAAVKAERRGPTWRAVQADPFRPCSHCKPARPCGQRDISPESHPRCAAHAHRPLMWIAGVWHSQPRFKI